MLGEHFGQHCQWRQKSRRQWRANLCDCVRHLEDARGTLQADPFKCHLVTTVARLHLHSFKQPIQIAQELTQTQLDEVESESTSSHIVH